MSSPSSSLSAEEKRIRAITKSAGFLQSCFPPNRQAGAARTLAKLGGPQPDSALLQTLLEGTSYTRLSPVDCPNPSCGRSFLFSECNRDGDTYRCVWCNKLVNGDGSFSPPDASILLPKGLRALERSFNLAFIDYSLAYFGASALVNCYVSPRNEHDKSLITVTVLIRKVVEEQQQADNHTAIAASGSDSLDGSIWNSSHIINLRLDRDYQVDVTSSSTVYIESQSPPCRFSGHVTRPNPKYALPIPERLHEDFEANRSDITSFCSRSPATRQILVGTVGDLVQRAENRLRDVIGSIYFGKSAQVGTDLRCPIGRTEQGQTRMMTAVTGNDGSRSGAAMSFPSVDASGNAYSSLQPKPQQSSAAKTPTTTATVPTVPTQNNNITSNSSHQSLASQDVDHHQVDKSQQWEEALDEDSGETYFVNVETGETEWYLPEGGVIVNNDNKNKNSNNSSSKKDKKEKKEKKDKKDKKKHHHHHHQEDEEEVNDDDVPTGVEDAGQEEEEWTISSVLYSLELGGDVEEYVKLLADAEVNTVEELLQCDKDYLKDTVGITSSSDRKKLSKWINETYEASQ